MEIYDLAIARQILKLQRNPCGAVKKLMVSENGAAMLAGLALLVSIGKEYDFKRKKLPNALTDDVFILQQELSVLAFRGWLKNIGSHYTLEGNTSKICIEAEKDPELIRVILLDKPENILHFFKDIFALNNAFEKACLVSRKCQQLSSCSKL